MEPGSPRWWREDLARSLGLVVASAGLASVAPGDGASLLCDRDGVAWLLVLPRAARGEAVLSAAPGDAVAPGEAASAGEYLVRGDAVALGEAVAAGGLVARGEAVAAGEYAAPGEAVAIGLAEPVAAPVTPVVVVPVVVMPEVPPVTPIPACGVTP